MDEEILTIDQVSDFLKVSQPTIFRLVAEGKLKKIHIYSALRFRKSDVLEYVANL